MEFHKKQVIILLAIIIIAVGAISVASAYTGTGF